MLSTFTVVNTNDSGACSLRQAIIDADAAGTGTAANPDTIAFNIPITDPGYQSSTESFLIQPGPTTTTFGPGGIVAGLPVVTDTVIINGYTQPCAKCNTLASGDNAALKIQLDGSKAGDYGVGLVLSSGGSAVRGLVVSNWGAYGIWSTGDNNLISGNFVGTDVTGTVAQANSASSMRLVYNLPNSAITIMGAYNRIGGTDPAARNIISGNLSEAITITSIDTGTVQGTVVEGSFIGTDVTGTTGLANQGDGINVWGAPDTIIGGSSQAARNVISDNLGLPGIGGGSPGDNSEIDALGSDQLSVRGNYIGTDVTGTLAFPQNLQNSLAGINIYDCTGWTIGGIAPGAGNLISVNGSNGIAVDISTGGVVQGNLIGTDYSGTVGLGSGMRFDGIVFNNVSNSLIGGSDPAARNLISHNNTGIILAGTANDTITGNLIGTDVNGIGSYETNLSNALGILIENAATFNIIGPGNVIAGNNSAGVDITDLGTNNNVVDGNFIGTDVTGTLFQANEGDGVQIENDASNNTIGGTAAGAGNIIAFNRGDGVDVVSGTGNTIRGNSIRDNSRLGIQLVSANNANNNQAFPVLTFYSSSSGDTTVSGTLASTANTSFALEFFANAAPDPSGYGQGQTFLGSMIVPTGTSNFTLTGLAPLPAGQIYVSATATNLSTGDTSEFSQDLLAAPTVTTVVSSANPSFFGQAVTFTATVATSTSGAGTPTGNVDFVDTTTGIDLGTVPLSGGSATLSTSSLTAGANTIIAVYSGGSSFAAIYAVAFLPSSGSLTQTVVPTILVLDPSAGGALSLSGNASINVPGNVVVDSKSNSALSASGNASVSASSIQVVGNFQKSSNATLSPTPVTGAAFVANPLASLTGPSTSGLTNFGSASYSGNSSVTLQPGIYSRISASGYASVKLNPGLYLIEGGGFAVSGNASITGTGIMIYNTGSNYPNAGGNFGGITLSGNGTFSLTASATSANGTDAGILIFQPSANTRALSLSGNGVAGITGTLYAPSAQVIVSGNAMLAGSIVADELSLSGNGVSTQVADGSAGSAIDTAGAGTLLAGSLFVYISDPSGFFNANELSRIQDAINTWDNLLVPYSVTITEVSDPILANVVIDTGSTSGAGSAADGILGCYNSTGEITILQGWNWYDGSDSTQIGATQYDFQTVMTHELGHALGLGGNDDTSSPMYETLAAGIVRRTPAASDLNIPEPPEGADPERAQLPTIGQTFVDIVAPSLSVGTFQVEAGVASPLTAVSRGFGPDPGSTQGIFGFNKPAFEATGLVARPTESGTAAEMGLAEESVLPSLPVLLLPSGLPAEKLDTDWLLESPGVADTRGLTQDPFMALDVGGISKNGDSFEQPMNEWAKSRECFATDLAATNFACFGGAEQMDKAEPRFVLDSSTKRCDVTDLIFAALGLLAIPLRAPREKKSAHEVEGAETPN